MNNNVLRRISIKNNSLLKYFNESNENLFEESLKQTDQYRLKYENTFSKQIFHENSKFQFPQKPNIPIEYLEKFNENHLNKIDDILDRNTLIGQYEITNIMNPIKKRFY
jgi:hypothetical protein